MRYRFCGDKLEIVKYVLTINIPFKFGGEDTPNARTMTAADDAERDMILEKYPDATVEMVDNTGYEWLDGMIFTQEKIRNGEVEQAITMGQAAYQALHNAPSQDEVNAMLLLKIAELTTQLAEVKSNE